jgi:LCP family protein required for cell wall assembly
MRRGLMLRVLGATIGMALLSVAVITGLRRVAPPARAASGPVMLLHSAHGSSYIPALSGERPLFILVLGSDARPPTPIERSRSDSIHIIGVDLKNHRASVLGFPRDSWVDIPGHGMGKINTAMWEGGPRLIVDTLENLTGITIDFWLLTNFNAFMRMVNGIGGLTVDIPIALDDHDSGAHFPAGPRHVNGKDALAFARDRHDFQLGDFSRSENQGSILVSALTKLQTKFVKDPSVLFDWIVTGWRNATLTTDLSVHTLLDLALTATQIPASKVNNMVVPGYTGTVGEASVVFISSSAKAVYADMRADGYISNVP